MHSGNFFKKILNIEGAMTIQILKCFFLKKGGRHLNCFPLVANISRFQFLIMNLSNKLCMFLVQR